MKITLTLEVPDDVVRSVPHWNCEEDLDSDRVHEKVCELFKESLCRAIGIPEDTYIDLYCPEWDHYKHPGYAKFLDEFWRIHEMSPLAQLAEVAE